MYSLYPISVLQKTHLVYKLWFQVKNHLVRVEEAQDCNGHLCKKDQGEAK